MDLTSVVNLCHSGNQGEEGKYHEGDSPKGVFANVVGMSLVSLQDGDKSLFGGVPGLKR